jgi:hypothetical protein
MRDLPGSRPYRRQRTMRAHMNDPSNMLDRQAAAIAVEATMTNLELLYQCSV